MKAWEVWLAFYGTYAEIEAESDRKQQLVACGLTWAQAQEMVDRLGFGHHIVPAGLRGPL